MLKLRYLGVGWAGTTRPSPTQHLCPNQRGHSRCLEGLHQSLEVLLQQKGNHEEVVLKEWRVGSLVLVIGHVVVSGSGNGV